MARHRKHKNRKKGGGGAGYPTTFTRPLTPRSFRQESRAQAKLQFGDAQRQIQGEKRASALRTHEIGGWFSGPGGYLDKLRSLQGQTQTAYGQANDQMNARLSANQGQDEALRQRLAAQAQADAQVRGVAYSPYQENLQAGASLARQEQLGSFANLASLQGANQNAYLADKRRIGAREEINQKLREQNRGRSYDSDLRDLAQKKGAFKTAYRQDARDSERKFYLALQQLAQNAAANKIKGGYNKAIQNVASLGLAGKQASAGATVKSAKLGLKGKRATARALKRQAQLQKRGKLGAARLGKSGHRKHGKHRKKHRKPPRAYGF